MNRLASVLRRRGHTVAIAPLGLNVDCGEATVERVIAHLDAPTTLIGHSRGGQLAVVAAVRSGELVETLVTVGTPWSIGPPPMPGVDVAARAIRALQRRGVSVMSSIDCATDGCCDRFRAELMEKPAARWVALWSSNDRIAGADGVPPDRADAVVDVGGSHLGLITTNRGVGAVINALEPTPLR